MRDFSNYEKQGPRAGHTVPHEVTELVNPDGTHPIVHIENLGVANASFQQWLLSQAGGEPPSDVVTAERDLVIAHAARRLERAFFADGTEATDADLPAFIRAMPLRAFLRLRDAALEETKFCEFPIATKTQVLAEK